MSVNQSDRTKLLQASGSMAMAEKVRKMPNVINATVGEPDFETPQNIKNAAIKAIQSGKTRYTSSKGIEGLRDAIKQSFNSLYNADYSFDEIVVVPGLKQGLMQTIQAYVNNGDEVILFEPCWLSYKDMVYAAEGTPVMISAKKDFKPDLDRLDDAITERTKIILINNPVNPSGYVWQREEMEVIADLAIKNDLLIVADEIYDHINFVPFISFSQIPGIRDRLIIGNGFSKTYAMTGWRIAYLIGDMELMKPIFLLHQHIATCVAEFTQYAAMEALNGPQDFVSMMKEEYKRRRDILIDGLKNSPWKPVVPDGTFYLMLYTGHISGTPDLRVDYILENHMVATVPGKAYGDSSIDYVRLSYAMSIESIHLTIERLLK